MAERVHQRMHAQAPFVKCILNMLAESAWLKREPMRAQTISRSKKRRHERVRQEERGGQLHPLNPVLAWQTAATAASAAAAALASRTGVLAHVRSNLLSLVGCVCNLGTCPSACNLLQSGKRQTFLLVWRKRGREPSTSVEEISSSESAAVPPPSTPPQLAYPSKGPSKDPPMCISRVACGESVL